jgi:hypothetical protein
MQHFGEHLRRGAKLLAEQLSPQATSVLFKHFTTHVGHASSHPTVICPPRQDLFSEHAELWANV